MKRQTLWNAFSGTPKVERADCGTKAMERLCFQTCCGLATVRSERYLLQAYEKQTLWSACSGTQHLERADGGTHTMERLCVQSTVGLAKVRSENYMLQAHEKQQIKLTNTRCDVVCVTCVPFCALGWKAWLVVSLLRVRNRGAHLLERV